MHRRLDEFQSEADNGTSRGTTAELRPHATSHCSCTSEQPPPQFMLDHVGWVPVGPDRWKRSVTLPNGRIGKLLATSSGIIEGYPEVAPFVDCFAAPSSRPGLSTVFRDAVVVRLATPTVWEAVAAAVVRQVIRADQARLLYQRLLGSNEAFPSPATVVKLGEAHFRTLGMGFKARTLLRIAEEFLHHEMPAAPSGNPDELLAVLQRTPGIGPWTAQVACSDHLNAWEYYPMSDLAVRTWAQRLTDIPWPARPDEFEKRWRSRTAPHTATATAHLLSRAQAAI